MISNLHRRIDLRYASNRTVVVLAMVAFLLGLGWVIRDGDFARAFSIAFNLAAAVFLGWAVARELDPDSPTTATVAAVLSGVIRILVGPIAIAGSAVALIAARVLVRSTGRPPNAVDHLFLLVLATWAGQTAPGWIAGLGLSYALARDVRLVNGARRRQLLWAGAIAAGATIGALWAPISLDPEWSPAAIVVLLIGVLASLTTTTPPPASHADLTGEPLDMARLVSARRVSLVIGVFGALTGAVGVSGLAPVWGALIAVAGVQRSGGHPATPKHRK